MISRLTTLGVAFFGLMAILALVAAILFTRLLTNEIEVPKPVACYFELRDDCAPPEADKFHLRIEELQRRERELEAKIDKLRKLEDGVEYVTLFAENPLGRGDFVVVTGVRYNKFVDLQLWSSAWCHIRLPGGGSGVRSILTIANASPRGGVSTVRVSAGTLKDVGLSHADLEKALTLCQWPDPPS